MIGDVLDLVMVIAWIAGIVIAKGFFATCGAILIPPYAWFLVAERLINAMG